MNEGGRVAAVGRFARWQLGSRLLGQPCLLPFATDGVLVTSRGDTGATGNYYCGVHEYPDMPFVAHALEPGDLFVDAGANVGAYTVLAGAVAGADVVSCEPVPSTFSKLQRNVAANMLQDRVTACHTAVGRKPGECRMTSGRDAMNHVVAEGEAASDVVTVPVSRIDDLVPAGRARMMKMDVEGFEREALAGAERLLSEASLLAVLIEMNGAGRRYGVEDAELDETLRKAGLAPATYDPVERALTPASTFGSRGNTLYVRESEELAERLRRSEPLRAFGRAV
ncbi:MAG: FkbM family methyltransferase [Planctomycetota bacterium]